MRAFSHTLFAAAALCGAYAIAPVQAQAADDIHCFSHQAQAEFEQAMTIFDVLGVDESELTDAQRIDMLEEYERNGWSQRLRNTPWLDMQHNYRRSRIGKKLVYGAQGFHWLDAWTMMGVERHAERMSRRTGSKYIYVSPEMKRMARERDTTRGLMKKRKCYPNVTYVG